MSVFNIAGKVVPMVGSVLVLGSILLPFLEVVYIHGGMWIPELEFVKCKFWSFRTSCEGWGWPTHTEMRVFDYWFHDYLIVETGLSWIVLSLFITQILTLTMGIASIFINKRVFSITPVILCPISIALMICTFARFSEAGLPGGAISGTNYLHGYWLSYPSELLFIINFLLKRKIRNLG